MAKDSKTILLFTEQRDAIGYLTDEEAGQIFKAIYDYADEGVVPKFPGPMMSVFAMIRSQIDRSRDAYTMHPNSRKPTNACHRIRTHATVSLRIPSHAFLILIQIQKKIQILTLMMELTLPSSMMWK